MIDDSRITKPEDGLPAIEIVRHLLDAETRRLTTAPGVDPRTNPMVGNFLGGITAALDALVEAAAPTPAAGGRALPGDRATCERCGAAIVWATTTARESGPGGKAMPLDPVENSDGNVAAWRGHGRRVLARVLHRDEQHDAPLEFLAMPHFATCRRR